VPSQIIDISLPLQNHTVMLQGLLEEVTDV